MEITDQLSSDVEVFSERNIQEILMSFMEKRFSLLFEGEIDANADLFRLGIMDSHGYIEMVRFIEKAFDIRFSQRDILLNVAPSLAEMTSMVAVKLSMNHAR